MASYLLATTLTLQTKFGFDDFARPGGARHAEQYGAAVRLDFVVEIH